eukprot:snap_masked-scaffold_89-processed-gene-0.33-mRNA-1 protein AED:1.00 eAED:1.00 QI:0/0/0/0/1/1/2/0/63
MIVVGDETVSFNSLLRKLYNCLWKQTKIHLPERPDSVLCFSLQTYYYDTTHGDIKVKPALTAA